MPCVIDSAVAVPGAQIGLDAVVALDREVARSFHHQGKRADGRAAGSETDLRGQDRSGQDVGEQESAGEAAKTPATTAAFLGTKRMGSSLFRFLCLREFARALSAGRWYLPTHGRWPDSRRVGGSFDRLRIQ